ncbi:MAG: dihydrolipoamide acetyltransferase family protein, partial [Candidatus Binataceae bacterium]
YEVETEKVLYEVEAPASGTLAAWTHEEGAIVECGGVVALIATPGEDLAALAGRYAGSAARSAASASIAIATAPATAGNGETADVNADGRRAVSPVARKLAAQLGVDLGRVIGTGPGGRVTREDVEGAARNPAMRTAAASGNGAPQMTLPTAVDNSSAVAKPRLRGTPMRGMRKTIAARMQQSLRETAQLTISSEADVTAAVELRSRLMREFDFTYTDLMIHGVARALARHPRMNSRLADDAIISLAEINIGMAVALDEGLIVPVIRAADRKDLRAIALETKELGERARSGRLKLEDVGGGTFTITNLGAFGVDVFTPILNLGEAGILGVGRIVEKPAVYRGEIVRRSMVALSLTFDHRIIDGAPAAAFLQTVID